MIWFWILTGFGFCNRQFSDFDWILKYYCWIGFGFEKHKSIHIRCMYDRFKLISIYGLTYVKSKVALTDKLAFAAKEVQQSLKFLTIVHQPFKVKLLPWSLSHQMCHHECNKSVEKRVSNCLQKCFKIGFQTAFWTEMVTQTIIFSEKQLKWQVRMINVWVQFAL